MKLTNRISKIIIATLIITLFFTIFNNASAQSTVQQQVQSGKVQSSYVCYVNNKYMGKEQIPVDVEGKIYYGCCQGCVGNLKNNRSVRYAKEPLTGKEVDKATAYIVIKPGGNGGVLYFASEQNYKKYLKKN